MRYIRAVGVLLLVILAMAIPAAATGPPVSTPAGVESLLGGESPVILPETTQDEAIRGDHSRDSGGRNSNSIQYLRTGDRTETTAGVIGKSAYPLLC